MGLTDSKVYFRVEKFYPKVNVPCQTGLNVCLKTLVWLFSGPRGVEPPTTAVTGQNSNLLSYGPRVWNFSFRLLNLPITRVEPVTFCV